MIAAYEAMFELNVDKTNSQYKAPVKQIWNEWKVFTPKDTACVTPKSAACVSCDFPSAPVV